MFKKTLSWLLKAGVSGILAFAILTGFCMLYYNVPVHYETLDGATDYSWEKDKFYSRGTEGFAWGKTNNEGYLNTFDYTEGMNIDILFMGSSHTEAFNTAMNKSSATVLGQLLPDKTVYNIGTSGHTFMVCADNLENAVNKYKPTKYVIIETTDLSYNDKELQQAIDGTVPDLSSRSGGIVELLQKNPFLRLMYVQLQNFMGNDSDSEAAPASQAANSVGSDEMYDKLLAKLEKTVRDAGAKLIILHHSALTLNEDGTASVSNDELRSSFAAACERTGVIFLDMSERFLECYEEESILPHGFTNTSVGTGHLNKNGHAMIAESLYEIIKEAE